MHQRVIVTVVVNGKDRRRPQVTCPFNNQSFVIYNDGQTCPRCGQAFNSSGQPINNVRLW